MHGAGAALSDAAAELGSGELQGVTKHPQEGSIVRNLNGNIPAVDAELCHDAILVKQ
jgi:hypothetical protein